MMQELLTGKTRIKGLARWTRLSYLWESQFKIYFNTQPIN
jgi:hypothetical protein